MIEFGLAAHLVGETKPSASIEEGSHARIESRFVLDMMQAYRADHDIDRSLGKLELFEPLHQESDRCRRRRKRVIDSRSRDVDHLRRGIHEVERASRELRRELDREVTRAASQLYKRSRIWRNLFQEACNHFVIPRYGASYQRVVRLDHRREVSPGRRR